MSFNSNTSRVEYVVTSSATKTYTFNFAIFNETDLIVYKVPSGELPDDTIHRLTPVSDYTVTVNGEDGGFVELVNNPTVDDSIVIQRNLPIDRTVDFVNNGGIYSDILNNDQDYQTYLISDLVSIKDKFIRIPNSVVGFDTNIPAPEANGVLQITTDGTSIEFNTDIGEHVRIVSDNIDNVNIVGDDIDNVNAVAADLSNIDIVSNSITSVNTTATNISDVITVATNVTDLNTVATNIIDVGVVADNITHVNTVSTNISDVVTISNNISDVNSVVANMVDVNSLATNMVDINTVATDIANINITATNIADVNTIATNITDVTYFADRYQGDKAVDPTLRNDGTALQEGDLYFNTTDSVMKVYEGALWVAAYASLSGALLSTNNLSDLTDTTIARTNLDVYSTTEVDTFITTLATDIGTLATDIGTVADFEGALV